MMNTAVDSAAWDRTESSSSAERFAAPSGRKPSLDWRRFLQVRLKTVLLVMTVAAVAFAWYGYRLRSAPIGLEGYCPVSLTSEWRWVAGDTSNAVVFQGRRYLMTSEEAKARFEKSPERFAPIISGDDVVRRVDEQKSSPGDRRHGLTYDGRIYLFDSEATLERFWTNPEYYISQVRYGADSPSW